MMVKGGDMATEESEKKTLRQVWEHRFKFPNTPGLLPEL